MRDPEYGWREELRAGGGRFSIALRGRSEEGCSSEEFGGACRQRKTHPLATSVFLVVRRPKVWRGAGVGFAEGPEG